MRCPVREALSDEDQRRVAEETIAESTGCPGRGRDLRPLTGEHALISGALVAFSTLVALMRFQEAAWRRGDASPLIADQDKVTIVVLWRRSVPSGTASSPSSPPSIKEQPRSSSSPAKLRS
jgi:hypothetical protein